jgi:hypothetical protein
MLPPKTTFAFDDVRCVQDKGNAQDSTGFTPHINTDPNVDIAPKTSAAPQADPGSENEDPQEESVPKTSAAPLLPTYQMILACVVGAGDQARGFAVTNRGMFVIGG